MKCLWIPVIETRSYEIPFGIIASIKKHPNEVKDDVEEILRGVIDILKKERYIVKDEIIHPEDALGYIDRIMHCWEFFVYNNNKDAVLKDIRERLIGAPDFPKPLSADLVRVFLGYYIPIPDDYALFLSIAGLTISGDLIDINVAYLESYIKKVKKHAKLVIEQSNSMNKVLYGGTYGLGGKIYASDRFVVIERVHRALKHNHYDIITDKLVVDNNFVRYSYVPSNEALWEYI